MVRQDLSPSQQAVQAAHASLELGKSVGWRHQHPHLVLLGVPDEIELLKWLKIARTHDVSIVVFNEPDLNNSLTAFAVKSIGRFVAFSPLRPVKFQTEQKMNVIKGEWGYYPCERAMYKKLKRLNFLTIEARRRNAAWNRWDNKHPHNRVVYEKSKSCVTPNGQPIRQRRKPIGPAPEPILPPGWTREGRKPRSLTNQTMIDIHNDYLKARFPTTEAQVKPLVLTEARIDTLLQQLESWYTRS